MSYVIELAKKRVAKIFRSFIEAVVGNVLARVLPDPFRRIQFRPVGRKLEDFEIAAVRLEPVIRFLLLVIGSIVMHQVNPMPVAIKGGYHDLVQKGQVSLPLKIVFLVQIDESSIVEANGAEDLLRVALSPRGDLWLAAPFGPRGMQGRRLTKRRLVFENDYRTLALGFFLDSDRYSAPICAVAANPPAPGDWWAAAPSSPIP